MTAKPDAASNDEVDVGVGAEAPSRAGDESATSSLDRLVAESKVLIIAGPGGVGKTTIGAALGLRAAQRHGRRVLVITVDPARRLAEVLGVDELTEESILVPVGTGPGRLWALMVDMAQSWNALIRREGSEEDANSLLANPLYQTLTRRFVQSHDYVALDHILDAGSVGDYDLIVVDTPPSSHAVDLLDAPGRIIEFFDGTLIKWFTSGTGGFFGRAASKPLTLAAQRLLGGQFLSEIGVFFSAMSNYGPALIRRARELQDRLAEPSTNYVVITTIEEVPSREATRLVDELTRRNHEPSLVILNKLPPTLRVTTSSDGKSELIPTLVEGASRELADKELQSAVEHLRNQAERAHVPEVSGDVELVAVEWSPIVPAELEQLGELLK